MTKRLHRLHRIGTGPGDAHGVFHAYQRLIDEARLPRLARTRAETLERLNRVGPARQADADRVRAFIDERGFAAFKRNMCRTFRHDGAHEARLSAGGQLGELGVRLLGRADVSAGGGPRATRPQVPDRAELVAGTPEGSRAIEGALDYALAWRNQGEPAVKVAVVATSQDPPGWRITAVTHIAARDFGRGLRLPEQVLEESADVRVANGTLTVKTSSAEDSILVGGSVRLPAEPAPESLANAVAYIFAEERKFHRAAADLEQYAFTRGGRAVIEGTLARGLRGLLATVAFNEDATHPTWHVSHLGRRFSLSVRKNVVTLTKPDGSQERAGRCPVVASKPFELAWALGERLIRQIDPTLKDDPDRLDQLYRFMHADC